MASAGSQRRDSVTSRKLGSASRSRCIVRCCVESRANATAGGLGAAARRSLGGHHTGDGRWRWVLLLARQLAGRLIA